jgi:O-antigen/teichoic acid export membrane protein
MANPDGQSKPTTQTEPKGISFLSQIIIYGLGLALNYGIGFILLPVYSRLMPEADYGRLEVLNRTMEIISLLFLTQYGITYIRFYRDRVEAEYRRLVTSTCIYVVLLVAGVMAAAIALMRVDLSEWMFQSPEYSGYFVLCAVRYLLQMAFVVPFLYFQATEQPIKYIVISAVSFAVTLALNVVLLYTMDDKVAAILWAGILGTGTFVLAVGVPVFWRSAKKLDWGISRQIVKFSWSFTFLGFISFVLNSGDRLILNRYCGAAEVGIYSAGYKIAQVLNTFVFSPTIRAWTAKMVDVLRQPDGVRFLARLTTYVLLLYTILGVTVSVYSREIVSVMMDPRYFACYTIIPIIILAYAGDGLQMFMDSGFYYTKKTYLKMWHSISTAVCLVLYFLLIPRYCMAGAAWATAGAYAFFTSLAWYLSNRVLPAPYEFGKMAKIVLTAIVIYLVNVVFENYEQANYPQIREAARLAFPWTYHLVIIVIKAPLIWLYATAIHVMRVLEPEDKMRLREFINGLRSRFSPSSGVTMPQQRGGIL